VSKSFNQKIDTKLPTRFFLDFLLSRFWAFLGEGSSKNLTSPGTFLASEEPTNHVGVRHFVLSAPCRPPATWVDQPASVSLLFFLKNVLGRFSVRGAQQHHKQMLLKKSTNDTNFDVSSPSIFFWFYRVFGCFAVMGVQKNVLQNNRVEKFLQKNQQKSVDFIYHVFGRFPVKGVQKHHLK
jgi:hypothetical protein